MRWLALGLLGCTAPDVDSVCEQGATRIHCPRNTDAIELSRGSRDVHWQLPAGEPPPEGWPVVFLFQGALFPASLSWSGRKGAPFGAYHQARLTQTLLDHGFAVMTPEAAGEGLTCWATNLPQHAHDWDDTRDAELMQTLLDDIDAGAFGPLDGQRLFAAGISSGGYMTSRMAEAFPGRFEALAIASASWATCVGPVCVLPDKLPEDHPPTLFLHGGIDKIVPAFTSRGYHRRLEDEGVETHRIVRTLQGHKWSATAPEDVLDWFDR